MSSFSFSATAGQSQSTSKPKLVGNMIHDVVFDGCEIQDIVGVKDASQTYKVIKMKFSNDEGVYEHTVFEPKENDFVRGETSFTNKNGNTEKIPQPSNVETMMLLFKHIIDAYLPEVGAKIDRQEVNLQAPSWVALRELVVKILNNAKGRPAKKLKLIKDNKGEARIPGFFTGISKEGKVYVRNNWLGDKIAFSAYEMGKINGESNAKVTPAASFDNFSNTGSEDSGLDLNFDLTGL